MQDSEIRNLIEDILRSMTVAYESIEIDIDPITQNKIFIIKTSDSGLLIGEGGENYNAFTHLVKRISEKKLKEGQEFFIDINDYRKNLADKLKIKAKMLAERAKDMRSDVELEPMSSYERLIIHGTLSDYPNIKTESMGEGKSRRVIIKYVE